MLPKTVLWAAVSVVAVACGGTRSANSANLSLSANAKQAVTSTTQNAPTSLDLGNGISLDRVRVVVRKLKLEGTLSGAVGGATTSSATSGTTAGADGQTEMEQEPNDPNDPTLGPVLVDLSGAMLAGSVEQVFAGLVPQGTFHELKFVIGPVTPDQAGTDPKLAEMAAQNASVIIDGTVDGKAFTFVSSLVAEIDVEGDFVVSDAKANNITLSIDPKGWFGGTGSARLDPTDPANKSAIENNLKASTNAFEDDDKSGEENHAGDAASNVPPPA